MRPLLLLSLLAVPAAAQTVIESPPMADQLMGDHVFNLQWIDHPPGTATVTEEPKGQLRLHALQEGAKGDLAKVDGTITKVTAKHFELDGTVETRSSIVNGGKPCVRTGHFTFRITGGRKYWRLQQMESCEGNNVVDYVDVYFARPKAKTK